MRRKIIALELNTECLKVYQFFRFTEVWLFIGTLVHLHIGTFSTPKPSFLPYNFYKYQSPLFPLIMQF